MRKIKRAVHMLALVAGSSILTSCNPDAASDAGQYTVTDSMATAETKALYKNMKALSADKVMFGHQDALAYGVGRRDYKTGFSDVYDVTGSYPAVYGWDIGHIAFETNIDSIPFTKMIRHIKEGYARGGVITISWHEMHGKENAPVWSDDPAPRRMVPGGDMHGEFRERLNYIAAFFRALKDADNKPIPVIWRPYHEHNGDWFWWGKHNATVEEYVELWQYTFHYLKDTMNIHQLLYATSPDRSRMQTADDPEEFLYAYPGDEYVDIIGLDNYWDIGGSARYNTERTREEEDSLFVTSLRTIVKIAEEKGKIAALTETGNNQVSENNWFTDRILKPLKNDPEARKIAYFLVWRNAWTTHFFAPYPGHPASQDFIDFKNDELILFEEELPEMYK
jgi:mannan endo-1,4-beta-mannosidase